MPVALAQDAIALLIDLAERGEIDPWDVKVIDVIDRFLTDLDPFERAGQELYDANLSQSGQAFLYASMLLLLKADTLAQAEVIDTTDDTADAAEFLDLEGMAGAAPLPPFLERQLSRRAVAQPPRKRRVTLRELIAQLQTIAAALENQPARSRTRRPQSQSRKQAIRAIAQLAHQENLSEMAAALEQFFAEHWSNTEHAQSWLEFDLLLDLWTQIQAADQTIDPTSHPSPNHERVGVFWALLLLSAQSKVELVQAEFYQDLKIRLLPATTDSGEAAIAPRSSQPAPANSLPSE